MNNVEGIVNNQRSSYLPEDSVDLIFISNTYTYHHFEYPQSMLASIRRAIRSDGKLVIIDFRKQPGITSGWAMSHVRASREIVISEVEEAGFRLQREPILLKENYFLVFNKRRH